VLAPEFEPPGSRELARTSPFRQVTRALVIVEWRPRIASASRLKLHDLIGGMNQGGIVRGDHKTATAGG
jgi:hypothetical protein